jgi:hypothetical protein
MTDISHSVYQSGEKVSIAGLYEVVGAGFAYSLDENTVREFQPGQIFPDYVGRAVCWHLLKAIPVENPPDKHPDPPKPMQNASQSTERGAQIHG